jgi:IclR family KDG regulon transcriptional repressor
MNSVITTLKILEVICERKSGIKNSELARHLKLSPPNTYYYLKSLRENGYIYKDKDSGKYRATYKIVDMGSMVLANNEISEIAYPILLELSEDTKLTVHMALKEGNMGVCINKVGSCKTLPTITRIGEIFDLYPTALGKAILAWLSKDELSKYFEQVSLISFTKYTLTNKDALIKDLIKTRKRGYSIDNQEHRLGVKAMGVPIFDFNGVIGSISVPIIGHAKIKEIFAKVNKVASEISKRLGNRKISLYEISKK